MKMTLDLAIELILILGLVGAGFPNAAVLSQTPRESDLPPRPRLETGSEKTESPENKETPAEKTRFEFKKNGGVVYREIGDLEIKCDVYVPEGDGPFPAILAVHGGAWRQGSKFVLLRHAWKMAESGFVVVAINYRHAPEFPFPAQIHDCKHAIRWMKASASTYKIDPKRIGAFGYSAGGHLVSLLGTSDETDGLEGDVESEVKGFNSRVNAVAAGGAPCEFSWINEDSRLLTYWLGGTRKQIPATYRAASPTTYVSADDPPFFFFHGDSDALVPVESGLELHKRLIDAGVASQHRIAPGGGHLGTFSDLGWMDKAIEFFDENLKN